MSVVDPAALALAALENAAPIMLAALGEMAVERSGRVNLGVEGMMALGAAAAAAAGVAAGSAAAGLAAGAAAGAALAAAYVVLVLAIRADQIVVGLSLVFLGLGLGDVVGSLAGGVPAPPLRPALLGLDPVEAAAPALAAAVWLALYRTYPGVVLRAVGDSPGAAAERGLPVRLVQAVAVVAAGAAAGAAGAYMTLSLSYGKWYSGVTAGWGWVALGVVVLGYWHPLGVAAASYLIGLLFASRSLLPSLGVPPEAADAAPYLAVLAALALAARLAAKAGVRPPASVWRTV